MLLCVKERERERQHSVRVPKNEKREREEERPENERKKKWFSFSTRGSLLCSVRSLASLVRELLSLVAPKPALRKKKQNQEELGQKERLVTGSKRNQED